MEIFWVIIIVIIVWSLASEDKEPEVRFRTHKHKDSDGAVLKHKHDTPKGVNLHWHAEDGRVIPGDVPVEGHRAVGDPDWHAHQSPHDGQIFWHSHPEVPGYLDHYHRNDGAAIGANRADVIDVRRNNN